MNSKGQVIIEYMLMLAIVVIIAVSTYKKINGYFFENGGFFSRYANGMSQVFSAGNGVNLKYKKFSIRR